MSKEIFSASGRGRTIDDDDTPPVDRIEQLGPLRAVVHEDGSVTLTSPGGYRLRTFTRAEWVAFVQGVRDAEFDDLADDAG